MSWPLVLSFCQFLQQWQTVITLKYLKMVKIIISFGMILEAAMNNLTSNTVDTESSNSTSSILLWMSWVHCYKKAWLLFLDCPVKKNSNVQFLLCVRFIQNYNCSCFSTLNNNNSKNPALIWPAGDISMLKLIKVSFIKFLIKFLLYPWWDHIFRPLVFYR